MFEQHREHRAEAARQAALTQWQARHDAYEALIETARTFTGTTADGLLLVPDETVYLQVTDTALVEERRGPGTYVGHSQGISVPVVKLGGRQIRYRVGASKGHYVQGTPTPTAIDTGTTWVTSSRVVFQGARQTRECAFAKLIGVTHDDAEGTTTLSVSNRSKPVTVHYGPSCSETFEFRLDLALAHFRHRVDDLVAGLEADLAAIDAARPVEPAASPPVAVPAPDPPDPSSSHAPSSTPTTVSPPPAATADTQAESRAGVVAAGWYPDPWEIAPLRWWDGTNWSFQTADPAAPSPAPPQAPQAPPTPPTPPT